MNYVEKVSNSLDTLEDSLAFLARGELKHLVLLKTLQKFTVQAEELVDHLRCLRDALSE